MNGNWTKENYLKQYQYIHSTAVKRKQLIMLVKFTMLNIGTSKLLPIIFHQQLAVTKATESANLG